MLSKLQQVTIAICFISLSAYGQCPTVTTFSTATNKANQCPGESFGPTRSNDFIGGPYYAIPTSGKQGNLEVTWGSAQSILPAVQAIYEGPVRTTLVGGPAATQTSNSTSYCYYGTTGMGSNPDVTFFFVNPINDTAFYSCSYRKSGSNYVAYTQPTITTQPTTQHACVGFSTSFTVAATAAGGGALSYQWLKNNAEITGATSSTYTISSVAAGDTGRYSCVVAEANRNVIRSNQVSLTIDSGIVWTGSTDTSWNTAGNWVGGVVPTSTTNAYIADVTNAPTITGSRDCRCMVLGSGNLTVNGGTLSVRGNISTKGGTITATNGTINMNGATLAQSIDSGAFAGETVNNLTINNSLGVTLNGPLSVTGSLTPTSGVLTTNGFLTIASSASATGRIMTGSTSGGYISGDVTVQRYIPGGNRAFRFLTHPFSTSVSLSTIIDDIDITGNGGSSNGFTTSTTNAPSAYWFDAINADTATSGSNSGWTAFITADPDSAHWDQYEMLRVFVRGEKGQGLSGTNYTPNPVTLDITSTVNQGDQTLTMTRGTNSTYVISGNPFPAAIQMNALTVGSDISSNFTVWDVNQGVRGGYTSVPFATSYIMPVYGSFVVTVSANTNNTILIEEADKRSSAAQSLFKGTANDGYNVQIRLNDSTTFWDRVLLIFDSTAMTVEDKLDAVKLYNPSLDFYTLSSDTVRLSIDARAYKDSQVIPLGVTAYNRYNEYTFSVPDYSVPQGVQLYLEDKYLNKTEPLKEGFEYKFKVTTDSNSQGIDRFYIRQSGMPVSVKDLTHENARIQIVPNPTIGGNVKVSYNNISGSGTLRVVNISGVTVYTHDIEEGSGSTIIPADDLPAGVYIIEVSGDNARYSQKLIRR